MSNISSVKLSEKDKVGYDWEISIQDTLYANGFTFLANPRNIDAWKRNQANGCDLYIIDYDIQIEAKFVTKQVWESGLKYNYLPRFYSGKYKVVVTNDKKMYNKNCVASLFANGIQLMDLTELILFLHKTINRLYPEIHTLIELLGDSLEINSLMTVYHYFKGKREEYEALGLVFYSPSNSKIEGNVSRQSASDTGAWIPKITVTRRNIQ